MYKFSLVLATLGRSKEVEIFLKSLKCQKEVDFELIIVDQNTDDRVKILYNKFKDDMSIKYIKINQKGLSKARNIGLKYAEGDIIAFPDDDCEYPENLLVNVQKIFKENSNIFILTGKSKDKISYKDSNGMWSNESKQISCNNVFKTAISYTIFIKNKNIDDIKFDEKLGVGEYFGSAEESDLILSLLHKNYNGVYNPNICVYHPIKDEVKDRVYGYALGFGALIKKEIKERKNYSYILKLMKDILIKPLLGVLINIMKFNLDGIKIYYNKFIGRVRGFIEF